MFDNPLLSIGVKNRIPLRGKGEGGQKRRTETEGRAENERKRQERQPARQTDGSNKNVTPDLGVGCLKVMITLASG